MARASKSTDVARCARFASFTAYLCIAAAAIVLATAVLNGLQLGVELWPALVVLGILCALSWVRWRHSRPGGEERLATAAGVILVLSCGGLAGGLICLVGQTFALPFIDPLLHRADIMMGIDLQWVVRRIADTPGLPWIAAAAYNSSIPLLFASALGFAWIGRNERAWELCGVFNLCLLAATVSSALIPAAGPFHYLQIPADIRDALPPGSGTYHLNQLFALREAKRFVIDPTALHGVATFPSFHMALALMTAACWRDVPRLRLAMFAWQGLVILSTIPIGGHYVIDLMAGSVCWATAHMFWRAVADRATMASSLEEASPAFA